MNEPCFNVRIFNVIIFNLSALTSQRIAKCTTQKWLQRLLFQSIYLIREIFKIVRICNVGISNEFRVSTLPNAQYTNDYCVTSSEMTTVSTLQKLKCSSCIFNMRVFNEARVSALPHVPNKMTVELTFRKKNSAYVERLFQCGSCLVEHLKRKRTKKHRKISRHRVPLVINFIKRRVTLSMCFVAYLKGKGGKLRDENKRDWIERNVEHLFQYGSWLVGNVKRKVEKGNNFQKSSAPVNKIRCAFETHAYTDTDTHAHAHQHRHKLKITTRRAPLSTWFVPRRAFAASTAQIGSVHVCAVFHSCVWHDSVWMSHVTHIKESCDTYAWGTSYTWMSRVTHMNESWCTYEWVMGHIQLSHVTNMLEAGQNLE